MKIQIKNRWTGNIIFETDAESVGAAVVAALASKTNLSYADLRSASLRSADLSYADLRSLLSQRTILPDGDLIGWKKLVNGVICKLKIPSTAKRVGGLFGRKCRAEFVEVLEGEGRARHNGMEHKAGQVVYPDKFDPDPTVECSHGIHFFITKAEAKAW